MTTDQAPAQAASAQDENQEENQAGPRPWNPPVLSRDTDQDAARLYHLLERSKRSLKEGLTAAAKESGYQLKELRFTLTENEGLQAKAEFTLQQRPQLCSRANCLRERATVEERDTDNDVCRYHLPATYPEQPYPLVLDTLVAYEVPPGTNWDFYTPEEGNVEGEPVMVVTADHLAKEFRTPMRPLSDWETKELVSIPETVAFQLLADFAGKHFAWLHCERFARDFFLNPYEGRFHRMPELTLTQQAMHDWCEARVSEDPPTEQRRGPWEPDEWDRDD